MAEKNTPKTKEEPQATAKYIQAVGRRKTAIATVRLYVKGSGQITINNKKLIEYFPTILNQDIVNAPLKITDLLGKFDITIIVRGGGKTGQAEAIRLGIARVLQENDKELRKTLKVAGFLKRDARIKERKKPGLKRARKAPQWSKR